jgi:Transposase DDE domain
MNCPPNWRGESRLKKIAEAKAALEQEAREGAEAAKKAAEEKLEERHKKEQERGQKFGRRPPQVPDPEQARPEPAAQRNCTDPESRIMPDGAHKGSFVQAYNAQAAVDGAAQIIVAAEVTQESNDKRQLVPLLESVEQNLGRKPETVTADAGYFSAAALTDEKIKTVDLLIPPDRQKHSTPPEPAGTTSAPGAAPGETLAGQMRERLRGPEGKAIYKLRKQIVEPVFGQIKATRGIRAFLLRGFEKVQAEWKLICATHNLLKLFRASLRQQVA